jgi:hypothetical protein
VVRGDGEEVGSESNRGGQFILGRWLPVAFAVGVEAQGDRDGQRVVSCGSACGLRKQIVILNEAIHCPVGHRCLMCYLLENKADGRQTESCREAFLPQLLSSLLHPLMNLLGRTAFKIGRLQGVTCHTFG